LELRIAARRLDELQRCVRQGCGLDALARFDAALNSAILAWTRVPPDQAAGLQADLVALADEAALRLQSVDAQGIDFALRRGALFKV
jgi:hypothetical protein